MKEEGVRKKLETEEDREIRGKCRGDIQEEKGRDGKIDR